MHPDVHPNVHAGAVRPIAAADRGNTVASPPSSTGAAGGRTQSGGLPAAVTREFAMIADRRLRLAKTAVFAAALVPLATLVVSAFTGGLGANPVETITHTTGEWTLRLLLVTLAITPLRHLTGWMWLIRLRRMVGLFAFFYLALHFTTYVVLDASLDPAYIVEDVADRLYITAGFTAFLMLIPLAATSTNAMVRRLGPLRWRRLHRLVYAAGVCGALHFLWLVKADIREPLVYAAILALLLAARLPPVAKWLQTRRARRRTGRAAATATF